MPSLSNFPVPSPSSALSAVTAAWEGVHRQWKHMESIDREEWLKRMNERLLRANPFYSNDVPVLTYQPTPFNLSVLSRMPSLRRPYYPTPWMRSSHAQSLLGTLLRMRPSIVYNREILHLTDGGAIALDWDSGRTEGRSVRYLLDQQFPTRLHPSSSRQPIILLLPGLTGGSNSKYLCQTVELIRARGWQSAVFNFRGIHEPMRTPKPSTGICVEDVKETIAHLHACYPHAPKLCIGYSMGANILVRTLGLLGEGTREKYGLIGAASVSNAFDFVKLSRSLEAPINKLLYSRFLTWQLKNRYIYQSNVQRLSRHLIADMPLALKSSTIREMDDRFTKHLYGIADVDEYYSRQSSCHVVERVATPLFCLNALDDPFEGQIPFDAIRRNHAILLATTERGGHVAWTTGVNPIRPKSSWMMATTLEYIQAALETYQHQQQQHHQQAP